MTALVSSSANLFLRGGRTKQSSPPIAGAGFYPAPAQAFLNLRKSFESADKLLLIDLIGPSIVFPLSSGAFFLKRFLPAFRVGDQRNFDAPPLGFEFPRTATKDVQIFLRDLCKRLPD